MPNDRRAAAGEAPPRAGRRSSMASRVRPPPRQTRARHRVVPRGRRSRSKARWSPRTFTHLPSLVVVAPPGSLSFWRRQKGRGRTRSTPLLQRFGVSGRQPAPSQYISSYPPPGAGFSSLGMSAMRASEVSSRVLTLAAFWRAEQVTLVGSISWPERAQSRILTRARISSTTLPGNLPTRSAFRALQSRLLS
jgi:hypothetical protein